MCASSACVTNTQFGDLCNMLMCSLPLVVLKWEHLLVYWQLIGQCLPCFLQADKISCAVASHLLHVVYTI